MKSLRIIVWDKQCESIKDIKEMRMVDIFKKHGPSNGFWRVFTDLVDKADISDVHITLSMVDYKKETDHEM